jgi:hypothetical protein
MAQRQKSTAVELVGQIDEAVAVEVEAKAAVHACLDHTTCEVICTMTFEKSGEDSYHTMMGVTPTLMTEEITGAGQNRYEAHKDAASKIRKPRQ